MGKSFRYNPDDYDNIKEKRKQAKKDKKIKRKLKKQVDRENETF